MDSSTEVKMMRELINVLKDIQTTLEKINNNLEDIERDL